MKVVSERLGHSSADLLAEIGEPNAQRLAEMLDSEEDPGRRNGLWQRLVDAWSRVACPTGQIEEVTATALPINEFTRLDDQRTPQLDLDYHSD